MKPIRPFLLAALIVLLLGPACSQAPAQNSQSPGLNLSGLGEKTRPPAEKQRDQEVDQAYKSATEKIPDRNAKVDPWHAMRGTITRQPNQAMMGALASFL